ncbi:unnamed protein product [Allacma fusca]|uniref:Methyltransferase-like protein 22 n=1 Tax=Allacma fusca TaxID=39272 RepID=A0A8J2LQR2_9HEXA|nr:unnamed protein product [Allacma fusca]
MKEAGNEAIVHEGVLQTLAFNHGLCCCVVGVCGPAVVHERVGRGINLKRWRNPLRIGRRTLRKSYGSFLKLQFVIPRGATNSRRESTQGVSVDEDGDLVVRRKNDSADMEESFMFIEYENSTKLEAVGLQIWRGAFLLADHIIANVSTIYKGKAVVELGAGTGLTSIVAAMFAKRVIATDLDEFSVLDLIKSNLKHNEKFVQSEFRIQPLDFTNTSWSPELEEFISQADVILAADVVYHERITQAFVTTLKKILSCGNKSKDIFIAMEKRYAFTIYDLDTVAPMYAHFVDELESVLNLSASSQSSFAVMHRSGSTSVQLTIQQIPLSFPQYFNYERTKELVLWHLSSTITP